MDTLAPEVMQELVQWYERQGQLQRLEQCLLHLKVHTLDLHQAVLLCQRHELTTGLLYIYNHGLHDWLTPLQYLFAAAQKAASSQRPSIVYKLLWYLSYCLRGKMFPSGEIPADRKRKVMMQLLRCLFKKDNSGHLDEPDSDPRRSPSPIPMNPVDPSAVPGSYKKQVSSDSTISPALSPSEENYPRVALLLSVDARQFMKVLWQAFEAGDAFSLDDKREISHMFYILDKICLENSSQKTYLAVVVAKASARGAIQLSSQVCESAIKALLKDRVEEISDSETEDLLVQMLNSCAGLELDFESFLRYAERANFHKVCVWLHEKRHDFARVLECYLQDNDFKPKVFDWIRQMMEGHELSGKQHQQVRQLVLSHLPDLVRLDGAATATLIRDTFANEQETVIQQLNSSPQLQLHYLETLIQKSKKPKEKDGEEDMQRPPTVAGSGSGSGRHMLSHRKGGSDPSRIVISVSMHVLYVKLLCQLQPQKVYSYLTTHDDYPLDDCLKLCQQYQVHNATAYLLERTGDVQGAMQLILKTVLSSLQRLEEALKKMDGVDHSETPTARGMSAVAQLPAMTEVQEALSMATALCQRNTQRLENSDSEMLWFGLLDHLVESHRKAVHEVSSMPRIVSRRVEDVINNLIRQILQSMMGYVAFPSILKKITSDHSQDEFGEFRETLISMLDTYAYQQNILRTANDLLAKDIYRSIQILHKRQARALVPRQFQCASCSQPVVGTDATFGSSNQLLVFDCGHTFHQRCVRVNAVGCELCQTQDKPSAMSRANRSRANSGQNPNTPTLPRREAAVTAGGPAATVGEAGSTVNKSLSADVYVRRLQNFYKKSNERSPMEIFQNLQREIS
eukprot:GILK01011401.1.p1 GENE.GILK01011401.1~~GILK01011401.1.p1  ORF type:complete len:872 (+),score=181.18 GILK01011401.1:61-2616(+)